jgi:hypothetical protein
MLHYVLFEGHFEIHSIELALHVTAFAVRHPAPYAVRVFHFDGIPKALTTNRALRIVLSGAPANGFCFVGNAFVQTPIARRVKEIGVDVFAFRVVPPRMWWVGLHKSSARKEWEWEFGFFWRGFRATGVSLAIRRIYVQLALHTNLCQPVVFMHDDVVASGDMQRENRNALIHDGLAADLVEHGATNTD